MPPTDSDGRADAARPSSCTGQAHGAVIQDVLAIVRGVDQRSLHPVASRQAGLAFQPRTLLVTVTYCYSIGIYCSQEIELEIAHGADFCRLDSEEFPRWKLIRQFRRLNHGVVQDCVATVLARQAHAEIPSGRFHCFADEAERRLSEAACLDSLADDD